MKRRIGTAQVRSYAYASAARLNFSQPLFFLDPLFGGLFSRQSLLYSPTFHHNKVIGGAGIYRRKIKDLAYENGGLCCSSIHASREFMRRLRRFR